MAKAKVAKKELEKEYWKITSKEWAKPVLRPKEATSERILERLKAKGYTVEEA